jgi:flagellar biosynthesis protein FliR
VTSQFADYPLLVFLVFCRVGAALMLLPGFSSPRFPPMVRLSVAVILSIALTPYLDLQMSDLPRHDVAGSIVSAVAGELLVGIAIGVTGSFFLHAVRFAGDVISNCIGLGGIPGQPVDSNDPLGQISSILTLSVTLMIFVTDMHLMAIGGLVSSYKVIGIGAPPNSRDFTPFLNTGLRDAFLLALQIASPFIVFSLLTNLIAGLLGRMAPKVSIYFSITGVMAVAGLLLLALASPQILMLVPGAYGTWLDGVVQ